MRKYTIMEENCLVKVNCNKCGRELKVENGILKEGCFHGENVFGYFSSLDGMKHSFDLCEECYSKVIQEFVLPVEETEANELL